MVRGKHCAYNIVIEADSKKNADKMLSTLTDSTKRYKLKVTRREQRQC